MGKIGWVITPLLIGAMVSCAGRDIVGIDVSMNLDATSGTVQIAGPLSVTAINGQGEYRVQEEYVGGKLLASIISDGPIATSALLLEVSYDAVAYSPVVAHIAEKLLGQPDVLSLESFETPGQVEVGVVSIGGRQIDIGKGETVLQIIFEAAVSEKAENLRSVSDVPSSANAVVPLLWDEDIGELQWYMVNPGDYDQNGEVGVSDLVPLAIHFGETGPFEYGQIQSVIDGNSDGEINLQDITTIALGFGNTVQGYNLYASADIADIPRGYTEPSVVEPVATFMLAEAVNAGARADERLFFNYTPTAGQQDLMFWARPFEVGATGVLSEGTRSNINGPTVSKNPDPDGPDFNFAPIASLSLEFLGSSVPLDVLLDGSESYDPDGNIAFYEWDFEGDGLVDAYSTDPVISHTYNNPGTFSPTLIVTDNHGGRDTFASPPFTATRDEVTNIVPFADLYATEYSGTPPLTVGLIATGSSDVDGYIARYEWDFDGDGSMDLDSGMDPTVMHTYNDAGVFACRVTVRDATGGSATAEVEIEVVEVIANTPPVAMLTADPTYGDEGVVVTLDASGSSDPDGEIVLYEYDFDGDGLFDTYGSSDAATHTYSHIGVFAAGVRVTDNGGAIDNVVTDVLVNEPVDLTAQWPSFGRDRRNTHLSPFVGSQTNNIKWTFSGLSSPVAIGADGTVYGGGLALNSDGSLKWQFPGGVYTNTSPALAQDGTIYVESNDSLHAINADGTYKWSYDTGHNISASPAVAVDGTVYVVNSYFVGLGNYDAKLYAINPDGTEKWSYEIGEQVHSTPAIGVDGTVYVGSYDKNLYAINPDGSLKWSYLTRFMIYSSPAIGADGTVYVGSRNMLYAINPDGSKKWAYTTADDVRSSPAIGADGTVFVGSDDDRLYAFNPDGSRKWFFLTSGDIRSSPAVDANGTVYVGSTDHNIYAINPDGSLKWSYTTGGYVVSSPAIASDGTVFVGCWDGNLYAISSLVPIAIVSASPEIGLFPLDVDFDASESTTYEGTIIGYEWDFNGDGIYDSSGTSSTSNHTYTDAGITNAIVRVTNNEGYQNTAEVEILVFNPGEWGSQAIDTSGYTGYETSLAVVAGNPAISYDDRTNRELKFVRATDASGFSWGTPVTVGSGGSVDNTCLAIVDGHPAISYYDQTNGDLMFVRATNAEGSSWGTPQTLDSTGTVGQYTSLAIVAGNPAISYFDNTNADLKFIRASDSTGSAWGAPQLIDSTGDVGSYTSLAVVDGNPAISYYGYNNYDLRYIRASDATGSTWNPPVSVDSTGSVGQYTSLAVVDGNPAISYYDISNSNLKFVRATDSTGSTWNPPVSVDSTGSVGQYTSLAVVDGNPVISYYDYTNRDLKYVQATNASGSTWATPLAVDTAGNVGIDTSLAVVGGSPAISYYHESNGDLKFARLY